MFNNRLTLPETVSSQIAEDNSISTVFFSKHKMELGKQNCSIIQFRKENVTSNYKHTN